MDNERAIEILKNFVGINLGFLSDEEFVTLELAIKALEQPQGEWVNREHYQVDEDGYDTMTCNKCGVDVDLPRNDVYYYCPNCGAKMT